MTLPTEPIGSIPRPLDLIAALTRTASDDPSLEPLYDAAIKDTIEQFEATGSPVITDGEQRKYHNFWTYSVDGLKNTAPDGFTIPFAAGSRRFATTHRLDAKRHSPKSKRASRVRRWPLPFLGLPRDH